MRAKPEMKRWRRHKERIVCERCLRQLKPFHFQMKDLIVQRILNKIIFSNYCHCLFILLIIIFVFELIK